MMRDFIIKLENANARNPMVRLPKTANFVLNTDEHIAIAGLNGSGKSLLVDMLIGKSLLREGSLNYHFEGSKTNSSFENIKYISFRDTYGSVEGNYYYQQRWNSQDADESPTVREMLGAVQDENLCNHYFELFGLTALLDKKIISLSSGELRKFQLAKALQTSPQVLILDNPFIGLDFSTRELLKSVLEDISKIENLQIILVLSMLDDLPDFITHVVPMKDGESLEKQTKTDYLQRFMEEDNYNQQQELSVYSDLTNKILNLPYINDCADGEDVIVMNDVKIVYGSRTILEQLNWRVKKGEKWALSGENGAGKSTLLSLVCADNPQSYACDISMFGHRRGVGESIWDVKKHIGYVSPEMHRAYLKNLPAIEIVASGLHDSIGLYKRPRPEQMSICEWWMGIFGIAHLKDTPFLHMSSGEQRLVLLARAFVKDPELLILDEPLHGLDTVNRRKVKKIIEAFCQREGKTLVMVTHYESELPNNITNRMFLKKKFK